MMQGYLESITFLDLESRMSVCKAGANFVSSNRYHETKSEFDVDPVEVFLDGPTVVLVSGESADEIIQATMEEVANRAAASLDRCIMQSIIDDDRIAAVRGDHRSVTGAMIGEIVEGDDSKTFFCIPSVANKLLVEGNLGGSGGTSVRSFRYIPVRWSLLGDFSKISLVYSSHEPILTRPYGKESNVFKISIDVVNESPECFSKFSCIDWD
jgi:hypothetical protein